MKTELTDFLKKEYTEAGIEPQYINLNNKEYLIPYVYVHQYEDFKKAFLKDFFDDMRFDYEAYKKNNAPLRHIRWQNDDIDIELIKPYALREDHVDYDEIIAAIFQKADKKYHLAVSLAEQLKTKWGKKNFPSLISSKNILAMVHAESVLKNKAEHALAQKVGQILKTAQKKTNHNPQWSLQNLRLAAHHWITKTALAVTAFSGLAYLSVPKDKQIKENKNKTETVTIQPVKKSSENLNTNTAQQDNESLKPLFYLQEQGSQADEISRHNETIFTEALNDIKIFLAFVEGYRQTAYDDGKGNITIGYGTTYIFTQNGEIRKVRPDEKLKSIAQADQYLTQHLLRVIKPAIQKLETKINDHKLMVVIASRMYLRGVNGFAQTELYQKILKGASIEDLQKSFHMKGNLDKRAYAEFLYLTGNLSSLYILKCPIGGAYNLTGSKLYIPGSKNFNLHEDVISQNLYEIGRTYGKKTVSDVLLKDIVQKTMNQKSSQASSQIQLYLDHYQKLSK